MPQQKYDVSLGKTCTNWFVTNLATRDTALRNNCAPKFYINAQYLWIYGETFCPARERERERKRRVFDDKPVCSIQEWVKGAIGRRVLAYVQPGTVKPGLCVEYGGGGEKRTMHKETKDKRESELKQWVDRSLQEMHSEEQVHFLRWHERWEQTGKIKKRCRERTCVLYGVSSRPLQSWHCICINILRQNRFSRFPHTGFSREVSQYSMDHDTNEAEH